MAANEIATDMEKRTVAKEVTKSGIHKNTNMEIAGSMDSLFIVTKYNNDINREVMKKNNRVHQNYELTIQSVEEQTQFRDANHLLQWPCIIK